MLISSPKRRCIETLDPLSQATGALIRVSKDLDEGGDCREKSTRALADWRRHDDPITVFCSHGDWIPEALEAWCGLQSELKKGGWAQFESEDAEARLKLTWLIQEL